MVRQLYEAWNRGDLQSAPGAPHVRTLSSGPRADLSRYLRPSIGDVKGFRRAVGELPRRPWQTLSVAVERIEPVGDDRVLALLRYQALGPGRRRSEDANTRKLVTLRETGW